MALRTSKRTKKTNGGKKIFIALLILLLVAGGGYAAYAYTSNDDSSSSKNSTSTKSTSKKTSSSNKDNSSDTGDTTEDSASDTIDESVDPSGFVEGKTPVQNEPTDNTTPSDQITGILNYKSVSDGKLVLRVTINQSLSSGTCSLTMTGPGSYSETAPVAANASSATCQGFDIPTSKLTSGTWSISISVSSDSKTGIIKDSVSL